MSSFPTLFLAACTVFAENISDSLKTTPDSWVVLDAKELNARAENAVSAGDSWSQSPLIVVVRLFGDDVETQSVLIEEVKDQGESPDAATIKYIRDGFLDDSVCGDWHQIDLHRLNDGSVKLERNGLHIGAGVVMTLNHTGESMPVIERFR